MENTNRRFHHQQYNNTMDSFADSMVSIDNNKDNEVSADKIKRPMNAFMLWSKLRRREISKNDPTIHNAQISKLLGEEWKMLPLENKQPFLMESQKLMVKHKREHPNYRYKPRKNKQDKSSGGGVSGGGAGYSAKPYALPTQAKPYNKYIESHSHYSSASSSSSSSRRMSNHQDRIHDSVPKHRPVVYYQDYRECQIPGCYECEYQRPYESYHRSRPNPSYRYHDNEFSNINSDARRCLCCSPPPPPPCMGCNHSTQQPHVHGSSKQRNNFSVESLINNRGNSPDYSSSSGKSNPQSLGSPGSSLSSASGSGAMTREEKQMNGDNSGSEGKSYTNDSGSCSDEL